MKRNNAEYMREYRKKKKQVCLVSPLKHVEPMHDPVVTDPEPQVTLPEIITNPVTPPTEPVTEHIKQLCEKLQEANQQLLNNHPIGVIKDYENKPDLDFRKEFNFSLIVLLILCNSFFLCYEQVTFYRACGYTLPLSIFLAILLEITPISLAYFASVYKKPMLNFAIIPAIFCIGAVIFLGLQSRANSTENVTRGTDILTEQISMLQEQAKEAEGKKLERLQTEILKKQEILRQQLPTKQANAVPELWIFAVIRFFAFVYNLIFAKLLAS